MTRDQLDKEHDAALDVVEHMNKRRVRGKGVYETIYERKVRGKKVKDVIFKGEKYTDGKPQSFKSYCKYDFFQYNRILYHYAKTDYGISRMHMDLIFYLYPIKVFDRKQFERMALVLTIYQDGIFNYFIENGYIDLGRPQKPKQKALYTLSNKMKMLCGTLHQIAAGEKKLPLHRISWLKREKRHEKLYLRLAKDLNKRNEERKKKKKKKRVISKSKRMPKL